MEDRMSFYADKINSVLLRRKVIDSPLVWGGWAGPEFMGPKAYAFVINLNQFPGKRIEALHHPDVMHDISTNLGGLKVAYANTQGFAYVVKEEKVHQLNPVDLVSFLGQVSCALIWGGRGSGKTSLLQWVVKNRDHKIVVLDPKPFRPGKWLHAEVCGQGANYEAIWKKIQDLGEEFKRRSQDTKGQQFEKMLIIIDEWWVINKELPGAAEIVFKIITIGREVGMDVFLCSATKSVQGLGIEGDGALRDAFEIVGLTKTETKTGARYSAAIETEAGPVRAKHPGPFDNKVELSKDDKILVILAVRKNEGYCSIDRMEQIIKETLPERFWKIENAPFSRYRLQGKFDEWEGLGLLTKPSRLASGQMVGRRVTPELWRLVNG